jgi:hypothetical protein
LITNIVTVDLELKRPSNFLYASMSNTHYYFALNRKAAERVLCLTWNQFLERFGWKGPSQWDDVGGYLAFALDRPELPEKPTAEQIAPILRRTIRETILRMSPQYYCLLELSYQLRRQSFVKVDLNVEGLEAQCDAMNICAIWAFLSGDIDGRTLWCVLTVHGEWATDLFSRWRPLLGQTERQRIESVLKRFGRCRPVFNWQTLKAVRDGHSALDEEDTRRFSRFIQHAWRKNWPVYSEGKRLLHFRDFKLGRTLNAASSDLHGNCLVHYYGP